MVIEMPTAFQIPAKGTINYQYIRVKGDIKQDMWVSAAEMRPGNPKVVHHAKLWVLPKGSKWHGQCRIWQAYEGSEGGRNDQMDGNDHSGQIQSGPWRPNL